MAFLGAFVFHFPVYLVYLCTVSEEVTKWFPGTNRLTVHLESLETSLAEAD
jgi:hypothetical protein